MVGSTPERERFFNRMLSRQAPQIRNDSKPKDYLPDLVKRTASVVEYAMNPEKSGCDSDHRNILEGFCADVANLAFVISATFK